MRRCVNIRKEKKKKEKTKKRMSVGRGLVPFFLNGEENVNGVTPEGQKEVDRTGEKYEGF